MKNRNLYILLGVAFLLLLGVFIMFRNAQQEVQHYRQTVTHSHLLLNEFRDLSGNLKSVQIMTKDFKGKDPAPIRQGLQPYIERINLNLIKLQRLNYDPQNEERLIRIGQNIFSQFQAYDTYLTIPDSMENGFKVLSDISYAATYSIDSSIVHTQNLLESGSIQLDREINQLTLWIVIFGLIAFAILGVAVWLRQKRYLVMGIR